MRNVLTIQPLIFLSAHLVFEINNDAAPTTDKAPKTNDGYAPAADITPVIETDDFDRGLIWRPTPDSKDEN